ncbi:MAG: hypothetical protein WC709_07760 [Thermoleophilia bacterium]
MITVTRCNAKDRPLRVNAYRILSIGCDPDGGCRVVFDNGVVWDLAEDAAEVEDRIRRATD